jgi:hypothetical protein
LLNEQQRGSSSKEGTMTGTAEKTATGSRRAWLVCAGLLGAGFARAGVPWPDALKTPAAKAAPKKHYLVSAIMREGVQDFSFRLVHSPQPAGSVDEAAGIFTRLALEKFPGHSVAQTVVTDLSLPPGACAKDKKTTPRKAGTTIYAVSAVMNKARDEFDTLLLNGWLPGNSADEALGRVLRDAMAKYPLYTPVSTLLTELDLTRAGCPAPGPLRIHGERA